MKKLLILSILVLIGGVFANKIVHRKVDNQCMLECLKDGNSSYVCDYYCSYQGGS